MKCFVVFGIALILFNVVDCVDFTDDILYDDIIEERAAISEEELYEKPKYDLKDAPSLFDKFVIDFRKIYLDEKDQNKHYKAFKKNLKEIIENNKSGGGSVSDINSFADYSDDELAKLSG